MHRSPENPDGSIPEITAVANEMYKHLFSIENVFTENNIVDGECTIERDAIYTEAERIKDILGPLESKIEKEEFVSEEDMDRVRELILELRRITQRIRSLIQKVKIGLS